MYARILYYFQSHTCSYFFWFERLELENSDKTMQVYSYDNPVKALADFEPDFYDLVLADINMP